MITVETVDKLIASSRPKPGLVRGISLAMLGLAIFLGALLINPDLLEWSGSLGMFFMQIIVIALVAAIIWSATRQRRLAGVLLDSFEAVQLKQWDRAQNALVKLLRYPIRQPQVRAESLLALAALAEARHLYEASQRIYESLLEESNADPIQIHTAQVALAAVMLRTGQITDAVDLVDRLARQELPEPLRAQVELLSLFREVTMGQAEAGVDRAQQRRELFRNHLSTRAGYGYGLLAAAFDRAGQPQSAEKYWHDATMLVRPQDLLERFSELAPIAEKYHAAEYAI
ncbi:MAG: hypothetical protein JSV03_17300 [Planctomycetota bacterium]|nr:MAG: hypothetical protein JSV03_17300 [Planctomycetota bacterium]